MERRLKIALIDDSFYPMVDGVANVVYNYAFYLSKKHDVTVFTSTPLIPIGKENFPFRVVRCKSHKHIKFGLYAIPNPKHDKAFLKEIYQRFDIIHLHSPLVIAHVAMKVAKRFDIPLINTLHTQYHLEMIDHMKSRLITKIGVATYLANCFNACDELWAMNAGTETLSRKYHYQGKVFILQNGCDFLPQALNEEQVKAFRAKWANPEEKLLLYVGRLSLMKNLKLTIEVCAKLRDLNFPFKFLIVGRGEDRDKLEKTVKKEHLENLVIFAGEVSNRADLQLYYTASDLLVFPSFYDTESLTKIEAAAVNLPTIFAKGSYTASSVNDNVNGYVAEAKVDTFADKIINIFANPELYQRVREEAKATLYKTWKQIVDLVEQRYYQVIDNHNKKD